MYENRYQSRNDTTLEQHSLAFVALNCGIKPILASNAAEEETKCIPHDFPRFREKKMRQVGA